MNEQLVTDMPGEDAAKAGLSKRIEALGWGVLFILTGGLLLVPGYVIPIGTWLVGVGLTLLGANLVRHINGLEMRGFNTVLGVTAVAGGLGLFLGIHVPVFEIFLILLGAHIILGALVEVRE